MNEPSDFATPTTGGDVRLYPDPRDTTIAAQVKELTRLRDEIERLRAEIIPLLKTIVICGGYLEPEGSSRAGWYGAMTLSHVRDAGDRLVELGVWERHPASSGGGDTGDGQGKGVTR